MEKRRGAIARGESLGGCDESEQTLAVKRRPLEMRIGRVMRSADPEQSRVARCAMGFCGKTSTVATSSVPDHVYVMSGPKRSNWQLLCSVWGVS